MSYALSKNSITSYRGDIIPLHTAFPKRTLQTRLKYVIRPSSLAVELIERYITSDQFFIKFLRLFT